MALPRKGTRTLVVEGVRYRYVGHGWRGEGEDFCELIIELAEAPREKIRARYTFTYLQDAYRAVGHALSVVMDRVPPYVARHTILIGLERGWTPDSGGGIRKLGNLDTAIDFSELKRTSQDPGRPERQSGDGKGT